VNIALLGAILARRGFFRLPLRVVGRIARIALASALMGASLHALLQAIGHWLDGSRAERLAVIAAIGAVSLVTYGAATVALGVLDKATIQRLLRRQS
jgi:putative peptidoglycan lipid II flippase